MADPNQIRASDIDTLALRLKRIAHDREFVDVAQLQFIGLEEIRNAYGDRWPEHRERIHNVAADFLRRRVTGNDLLINAGNGFIVVFGEAASAEAEVAAGRLSHALNEFFVGEAGAMPAPRVSVTSATVKHTALAATFGEIEVISDGKPEDAPRASSEGIDFRDVEWRFQPTWVVKRETLSSWYAAPYLRSSGVRVPGYLFEPDATSSAHFLAIDQAGISTADRALGDLVKQGKQALVGMSVHAATLTNLASRNRILAQLDRLDPSLGRYRIIKIAGVAPGFPRLYLREIIALLRARISNVVLGASWDEPDLPSLAHCGAVAVGVYLSPAVIASPPAVLAAALSRIGAGCQAAHAAHIQYSVEGQLQRDLALRLAGLGVDVITSPTIWPARSAPDGMLKWPAAKLAA